MDSSDNQLITGFALFADGSLHLQRGYNPQKMQLCCPDQLSANDFKHLLWNIEAALGARHNELQQTMPESIPSLLRVMALSHANRLSIFTDKPRYSITGAVFVWVRPFPIAIDCIQPNDKSARGSICQPVVGLLPRPVLPPGVHTPRVGHLGLVPEAGRAAVA
jgi:hypothetical protein